MLKNEWYGLSFKKTAKGKLTANKKNYHKVPLSLSISSQYLLKNTLSDVWLCIRRNSQNVFDSKHKSNESLALRLFSEDCQLLCEHRTYRQDDSTYFLSLWINQIFQTSDCLQEDEKRMLAWHFPAYCRLTVCPKSPVFFHGLPTL